MIKGQLGDHVEILSGFAFKSDRFNDEGRGLPLVRIRDVKPARSQTYFDGDYDARFVLSDGDLLVGMDGEFNCARWAGGPALLNQRVCRVRSASQQLDEQYLFWFLPKALKDIEDRSNFVTVKHLSAKQINEIEIPLPPLDEQKRIAAILDQADELRRKRQRAVDRLNQLGQAIFHEMFGDPVANPMGWNKVSLIDCCAASDDIRCGPFGTQLLKDEFRDTGVPLWGIKQVNKAFQIPTHEYVSTRKARELSNYDIVEDDIVMTRKGTIGNCAVYPHGFPPGIMHSDLLRVRIDRSKATSHFIADQLHFSRDVEWQIELISGGAIMQGINVGKLKKIRVLLPPMELQRAYREKIDAANAQAAMFKNQLTHINTLFASLQHRAFQGGL